MTTLSLAALLLVCLGLAAARSTEDAHLRHRRQAPKKLKDQIMTGLTGTIKSPDYPNKYPLSTEQTYTIQFPDPQAYYKVNINVQSLNIEYQSSCSWDYLLFNFGGIGKMCGSHTNKVYTATDQHNSVTIKFYSDYVVNAGGFELTYSLVKLPDGCSSEPCLNNATCSPVGRSDYTCTCQEGFLGINCEVALDTEPEDIAAPSNTTGNSSCASSPCFNGGYCYPSGNNYSCMCNAGYYGSRCQYMNSNTSGNSTGNSSCASSPCLNGGYCYPSGNSYSCMCNAGYYGSRCQYMNSNTSGNSTGNSSCASSPCFNGGYCYPSGNNYSCMCNAGYYGSRCQYMNSNTSGNSTGNSSCASSPCLNGGYCYPSGNSYSCMCNVDYYGSRCQYTNSNTSGNSTGNSSCASSPCLNGGYCYPSGNSYSCMCNSNYYGPRCQYMNSNTSGNSTGNSSCASSPCLNGGYCYPSGNNYSCMCNDNYYGSRCQYSSYNQTATSPPSASSGISVSQVYNMLLQALSKSSSTQQKLEKVQQVLQQIQTLLGFSN